MMSSNPKFCPYLALRGNVFSRDKLILCIQQAIGNLAQARDIHRGSCNSDDILFAALNERLERKVER